MDREFDLVVFGASGFTGLKVVEEVVRASERKRSSPLRWAVAGRNKAKVRGVLEQIAKKTGNSSVLNTTVLEADIGDFNSLVAMCSRARVLLNCVGPYRFYGEPVVQACLKATTDYVDITGEPQFIETMAKKYHEEAQKKGVLIINTCGFDSIPADIGTAYTAKQFGGPQNVSGVESYLTLHSGPNGVAGHFATYECIVHGLGDSKSLAQLRKSTKQVALPVNGPRLKRKTLFINDYLKEWCLPFMGSDASVVRRTQQLNWTDKKIAPVQFAAYFTVPTFYSILLFMFYGLIFGLLAKFDIGRKILLKFPKLFSYGMFSHEGPTERQMNQTYFSMIFEAYGYDASRPEPQNKKPNRRIVTRLHGPEPGYIATPIFMVQSALHILDDRNKLGYQGGVLTPAAAFHLDTFVDRIRQSGIELNVVKDERI